MDVVGQHTPWTTVCLPRSFIWPHWWNERSNWHCQALDFLAVFTKKHFFRVTEQWPLSQCTNVLLHKWSTQQGPVLPSGNAEQEGCHCHIHPALLWTAPQVREEAAGSCMSSSQATGIGKLLPTLQTRAFLYMQWQIIIWHICRTAGYMAAQVLPADVAFPSTYAQFLNPVWLKVSLMPHLSCKGLSSSRIYLHPPLRNSFHMDGTPGQVWEGLLFPLEAEGQSIPLSSVLLGYSPSWLRNLKITKSAIRTKKKMMTNCIFWLAFFFRVTPAYVFLFHLPLIMQTISGDARGKKVTARLFWVSAVFIYKSKCASPSDKWWDDCYCRKGLCRKNSS